MKKTIKKEAKLTKIEEKRVAVLKDAIAQIKLKAYNVRSGTGYINQDSGDLDTRINALVDVCDILEDKDASKVQLNKYFDKLINKKKPCQVCAKGAMLLSQINKFNHLSLDQAKDGQLDSLAGGNGTYELFGQENADLMEQYFEGDISEGDEEYEEEGDKNAKKWLAYRSDDKRLIAIFENAISNKGIFKP